MPDYSALTRLLDGELPDPRFVDDRYLTWLYDENPCGPAYQETAEEDGTPVAHYALVPQEYRGADGVVPGVFSLNAVTKTGTQRKGYFISLARELYKRAGEDGRDLAIGVPNAKSVGAGVKHLGLRLLGPMPVHVLVPTTTGRHVETIPVDESFLASARFDEIAADLDDWPATALTTRWTPEYLRWRLRRPHARYAVHLTPELFAVTTRTVQRGIPAAVVMKLIPRGGRRGRLPLRPIVGAACRHHRAPVGIYAGYNEHVPVKGIHPPRRVQPAPLFVLVWSLNDRLDQDTVQVGTYEFLDIDSF